MDLVIVWACLVGLAIILYVVLDGFTLGVALLFPSTQNEKERDVLMNSIAPVWDANQTWLVFGGGAIFAAFPLAYGVLFSALYIPLFTFIFGLIFRGVAFEFRANATRKKGWNKAFFFGSLVAVVAQGVTLGGLISGTRVEGTVRRDSLRLAQPLLPDGGNRPDRRIHPSGIDLSHHQDPGGDPGAGLRLGLLVGSGCPRIPDPGDRLDAIALPVRLHHWFSRPRIYFIWIFPLSGLIAFYLLLKGLKSRREILPFVCSVVLFLAGYFGLIASIYPYAIPPAVTLQEAAAQQETLRFTLWGAIIVLPVVLVYIVYSYWVFRGKVGEGESY